MNFDNKTRDYFLKQLQEIIQTDRWQKFEQVLNQRTRYLTIVLEDIFQNHNASAVLRTCECMGIQDLHVIENLNEYTINPDIVVGSNKWICIHKHNKKKRDNTLGCYKALKAQGYRIVATSPHEDGYLLDELPLDQKTALVFGNEGKGLTETAMKHADAFVKIPMYGFTESYNISVSAAICMHELGPRLRNSTYPWQLSEDEYKDLLLDFALKSIRYPIVFKKEMLGKLKNGVSMHRMHDPE
jgi:tRNA (guanosine-2'-O-)-methyltransferase